MVQNPMMKRIRLGNSGLKISPIILGFMSYGSSKWQQWVLDEDKALPIIKAAYDQGINTWDTANMYSNGQSEVVMANAMKKYQIPRDRVVIMTKAFWPVDEDVTTHNWEDSVAAKWEHGKGCGLSRASLFEQVNGSLKRLNTDYIDLLQIHRLDDTPFEEVMEALHDLVKSGKVRYIGASSMWCHEFVQLQSIAEKRGWTKFVSMQNYHNLLYREEGREMNRYCNKTGVAILPWSALAMGALARPAKQLMDTTRAGEISDQMKAMDTETDRTIINRVEEIAKKKGLTMAQVAFLWCKGETTAPLIGASKIERVQEFVEALKHSLTDEEKKYLEEPYKPKPVQGFNTDRSTS